MCLTVRLQQCFAEQRKSRCSCRLSGLGFRQALRLISTDEFIAEHCIVHTDEQRLSIGQRCRHWQLAFGKLAGSIFQINLIEHAVAIVLARPASI